MTDFRNTVQFERAYREHSPRAFSAAYGVLRDRSAAEDVVQDVFAELWRSPQSFDASRGNLRTYVVVLARSRAVDRWRTRSARKGAFDRLASDPVAERDRHEPSAAEQAMDRERASRVMSVVDRLPAPQREAVVLAFGGELTSREIADAVGVPAGTAKSRVRLGLKKARVALDEAA